MRSRERVILSLNHKEPDRIPIDLGATIVSSIVRKTYVDLEQYLGLPVGDIKMLDYVQQLPYIDECLDATFWGGFSHGPITGGHDGWSGYFRRRRLSCLHRSLGFETAYAQTRRLVFRLGRLPYQAGYHEGVGCVSMARTRFGRGQCTIGCAGKDPVRYYRLCPGG